MPHGPPSTAAGEQLSISFYVLQFFAASCRMSRYSFVIRKEE